MSTNSPCTRASPVSSGWNDVASTRPLPHGDDPTRGRWPSPGTRASTSTPSPVRSTHGARMKTACTGSPTPGEGEVGLERLDLPAEGVAPHDDVEPADASAGRAGRRAPRRPAGSCRRRSRRPAARRRRAARSGSSSSKTLEQPADRRRLAAGQDEPVEAVEVLRPAHRRPARRRPRAAPRSCSRTSPCSASTPTRGRGVTGPMRPTSRAWPAARRRRASRRRCRPSPRRGRG